MRKGLILINTAWLLVLLGVLAFGPGSLLKSLSAGSIVKDELLQHELSGRNLGAVEYLGKGAYRITTDKGDVIAVQTYTSVMNYTWEVYE